MDILVSFLVIAGGILVVFLPAVPAFKYGGKTQGFINIALSFFLWPVAVVHALWIWIGSKVGNSRERKWEGKHPDCKYTYYFRGTGMQGKRTSNPIDS